MFPFPSNKVFIVDAPTRSRIIRHMGIGILSLFLIGLGFNLLNIISDHTAVWMHPEVAGVYIPETLVTGPAIGLADIKKGLNPVTFEPVPRARPLSNLFLILSIKVRHALWTLFTPHPSINLNWILILFLTPMTVYLFLKNLSKKDRVALTGLLLYYSSVSVLSDLAMFFQAAKPLTSFFLFFCLWIAGHINEAMVTGQKKFQNRMWAILLTGMILGLLSDEGFTFVYFLVPAIYPEIFKDSQHRIKFMFPIVFFLGYVTVGMRFLSSQTPFMENVVAMRNVYGYHPSYYFVTLSNLFLEKISPRNFGVLTVVLPLGLIFGSISVFLNSISKYRSCVLRLCFGLAVFQILQTIIFARHVQYLTTEYYYGNYFMVFFVIGMSLILDLPGKLSPRYVLLGALLFVSVHNFRVTNFEWINRHQKIYTDFKPKEFKTLYLGNLELDAATTKKLLAQRKLKGNLPKQLRPSSLWLSTELGLRP